jgi:hypothetical protein
MKTAPLRNLTLLALLGVATARAETVDDLLAAYRGQGAGPFSAAAGEALWHKELPADDGTRRACTSCHTGDPKRPGRHATTGKAIDPIAPSANAKRLTERREIEKWLTRNCKWTLGRACSPQEKGDLLTFLSSQ